jgi:hypothetical protein
MLAGKRAEKRPLEIRSTDIQNKLTSSLNTIDMLLQM